MKKNIFILSTLILTNFLTFPALAQSPDKTPPCYGNNNYTTQTALTAMVNAGLIRNAANIYRDEKTPFSLTTTLLESKRVGTYSSQDFPASDVYRQTQKIAVRTKDNKAFEILTISETTNVECSLSEPAVIVVSPTLRVLGKGKFLLKSPS